MGERKIDSGRIDYIDGIRGVSSILVIFCHISCVFVPSLYSIEQAHNRFERFWINSPLNAITNGNMAVQSFFVISGFLIARKMYKANSRMDSPLREYRKLLRVVIPGILFSALLMISGLLFHLQAAEQNPMLSFVNDYNTFHPTFLNIIKDIFYSTFVDKSIYNGPFWTIKHEFLGAILITAVSYYAASNNKSKLFYLILGIALLFVNPYMVSFIIGAFAFDCINKENTDDTFLGIIIRFILSKKVLIVLLFFIALYFLSINNYLSGIWKPIKYIKLIDKTSEVTSAFGIGLFLVCVEKTQLIKRILSIKLLKFLGSISAYTYAFHWPIILSLGCGLYLVSKDYLPYYFSVLIIAISVILMTIILSFLFTVILPKIMCIEEKLIKIVFPFGRKKQNKD